MSCHVYSDPSFSKRPGSVQFMPCLCGKRQRWCAPVHLRICIVAFLTCCSVKRKSHYHDGIVCSFLLPAVFSRRSSAPSRTHLIHLILILSPFPSFILLLQRLVPICFEGQVDVEKVNTSTTTLTSSSTIQLPRVLEIDSIDRFSEPPMKGVLQIRNDGQVVLVWFLTKMTDTSDCTMRHFHGESSMCTYGGRRTKQY